MNAPKNFFRAFIRLAYTKLLYSNPTFDFQDPKTRDIRPKIQDSILKSQESRLKTQDAKFKIFLQEQNCRSSSHCTPSSTTTIFSSNKNLIYRFCVRLKE